VRRNLLAAVLRARGGHSFNHVIKSIETMSEAEVEQWWRLLQNVQEDARAAGSREGARQPWKHH